MQAMKERKEEKECIHPWWEKRGSKQKEEVEGKVLTRLSSKLRKEKVSFRKSEVRWEENVGMRAA